MIKQKFDRDSTIKELPLFLGMYMEDRLLIVNTLKACIPSDGSKTFDTRNVERQLIKQIINKGNKMEFIKGQTIKVKNNNDTEWATRIFKDKDERGFWCYDRFWPRLARCYDQAQPQLTIKVEDNWRKDSIFCDCELCKSLNKEK